MTYTDPTGVDVLGRPLVAVLGVRSDSALVQQLERDGLWVTVCRSTKEVERWCDDALGGVLIVSSTVGHQSLREVTERAHLDGRRQVLLLVSIGDHATIESALAMGIDDVLPTGAPLAVIRRRAEGWFRAEYSAAPVSREMARVCPHCLHVAPDPEGCPQCGAEGPVERWPTAAQTAYTWLGARVGRYELRMAVEEGVHGETYRAEDTRLGSPVIVKVVQLGRFYGLLDLERDVAQLAGLRDPGVPRVQDVIQINDREHAVVLSMVPGADVATIVRETGPLGLVEASEIVADTARVAAVLRSSGQLRGRVRAECLYVDRTGQGARVHLQDPWGSAPADATTPFMLDDAPRVASHTPIAVLELGHLFAFLLTGAVIVGAPRHVHGQLLTALQLDVTSALSRALLRALQVLSNPHAPLDQARQVCRALAEGARGELSRRVADPVGYDSFEQPPTTGMQRAEVEVFDDAPATDTWRQVLDELSGEEEVRLAALDETDRLIRAFLDDE